ncbi:TPA: hypothetical protein OT210_005235 [Klebsiella variicola]|nr:hypothetical protein [Klebsiella variicola]
MDKNCEVNLPFLVKYAVSRSGENNIPGYYSEGHDMWVLDDGFSQIPIIQKNQNIAETMTKTATYQEQDDQGGFLLLDTLTKSFSGHERDDADLENNYLDSLPVKNSIYCTNVISELMTKTDAIQERDDNAIGFDELLELTTKTNYELERDDSSEFDDVFFQ